MSCRMSVYQEAELNQEHTDTSSKNGLLRKYWLQSSWMFIIWNTLWNLGVILIVQQNSPQQQKQQYIDQWSDIVQTVNLQAQTILTAFAKKNHELWYFWYLWEQEEPRHSA
jgi:hypothetical protein